MFLTFSTRLPGPGRDKGKARVVGRVAGKAVDRDGAEAQETDGAHKQSLLKKGEYFMPFYEYECKDCSEHFEQLVSISEADLKQVCPHCNGKNTEKQLSVFAAKSSSPISVSGSGLT